MLLQTNSYIVPAEKRTEHQRLIRRFRQVMGRLGCDMFDVYEQVGPNWATGETTGRYVQIMRFRDHQHQRAVQAAERSDPTAQALIAEFCELINLPYQQQQGLFAVGFYRGVVKPSGGREQQSTEDSGAAEVLAEEQPVEPEQAGGDQGYVAGSSVEDQTYTTETEQAAGQGQDAATEEPSAEAPAYAPEEAAVGEAPAQQAGEESSFLDVLAVEEQEVEVEMEPEPQAQNGEQPGEVPPLALDDLDLESLAQEELSESQQRAKDKDRARRGG